MKKILLVFCILLLSGCVNGNRDFETICVKEEKSNGLTFNQELKIYFNSDNIITKTIDTYDYKYTDLNTFNAVKLSLDSFVKNKKYMNEEVLIDSDDEYKVTYIINYDDLKESDLNILGFDRNYYNQIKKYSDMECR